MNHKFQNLIFAVIIFLGFFGLAGSSEAAAPVLNFSDLTSAPKTGWEGSATKGAAVTIWGLNLGSSGTVSIGGQTLSSSDSNQIAEWGVTTYNPKVDANTTLQSITFWLNSSMATGATTISVTVSGVASNALLFTVKDLGSAHIRFIDHTNGNDSWDGTRATYVSGSTGPWRTMGKSNPSSNANIVAGDIMYVRNGTYTENDGGNGATMEIRDGGANGTSTNPIAWIGYPAERPAFSGTGIISVHNPGWAGRQTPFNYIIISRMQYTGALGLSVAWWGDYWRIINIHHTMTQGHNTGGMLSCFDCSYAWMLGNVFDGGNGDDWDHLIYPGGNWSDAIGPDEFHYIGYNEIKNWSATYAGGSGSTGNSSAINYRPGNGSINEIHIFNNYFHDSPNGTFCYFECDNPCDEFYVYNNLATNVNAYTDGASTYALIFHDSKGTSQNGIVYSYNNTFYNAAGGSDNAVLGTWNSGYVTSKNDIIYENAGYKYWATNPSNPVFNLDYDLMYGTGTELTGSYYAVAHKIASDPLFVNAAGGNFTLQSGSPAKDAGTSGVSAIVTKDLLSISRPQNSVYDIGAYEYVDAADTTPPASPNGLSVQ